MRATPAPHRSLQRMMSRQRRCSAFRITKGLSGLSGRRRNRCGFERPRRSHRESSLMGQSLHTADLLSKRLVLIDGTQLARLMIQHGVGCRVEETLAIKRLDEDVFEG